MIPVKLTVKGLYSYKEKAVIDFQTLNASGLFGIFGSVGSGKSSILEAITFSIYGESPRLNKSGDDRNYNMLNLKSDELLIDFEFTAGKDNQLFRIVTTSKRNKNQFDKVSKLQRTAYKWQNEDWQTIEIYQIIEQVGLNYDNFRRTVIIPQGKFQEFLQLSSGDRTKMLKEIFQLHKYDLSDATKSLLGACRQNLEVNSQRLEELNDIHEDLIKESEKQLASTREQILKKREESKEIRQQQVLLIQLKSLHSRFQELSNIKTTIEQQKTDIQLKENQLDEYQFALKHFNHSIHSINQHEAELKKTVESIQKNHSDTLLIQEKLPEISKKYQELFDIVKKQTHISEQINSFNTLLKIREKEDRIAQQKKWVETQKTKIESLKEKQNTLRNNAQQFQKQLQILEKNTLTEQEIRKASEWYHQFTSHQNKIKELNEIKLHISLEGKILKERLLNLLAIKNEQKPEEIPAFLKNQIQEKEAFVQSLNQAIQDLGIQVRLAEMGAQLKEDAPCPLCGSTHHPAKHSPSQAVSQKEELQKTEASLQKTHAEIRVLRSKYEESISLTTTLDNLRKDYISNEQNIKTEYNSVTQLMDSFGWSEHFDPKQADTYSNWIRHWEAEMQKRKDLEKNYASSHRELETLTSTREKAEGVYQQEISKHTSEVAQFELLQQQLSPTLHSSSSLGIDDIKKQRDELQSKLDYALQNIQAVEAQKKELEARFTQCQTLERSLKETEKNLHTTIKGHQDSIHQQLPYSSLDSIEKVKAILSRAEQMEQIAKEISTFKQRLLEVDSQLKEVSSTLEKTPYDASLHVQVNEKVKLLEGELEALLKQEEVILSSIQLTKERLQRKKELTKIQDQLHVRLENLKVLASMFRSNGFVDFVSRNYLQNLCKAAHQRFHQMTGHQLGLELSATENEFRIRDYMNNGLLRSVKTLSGGQLFQASFCLALALSDSVRSQTYAEKSFFFLDEGFGSLDKQSLETVFETLHSLQKENRIVGVISHVEELQQSINMYLQIENQPDTGSSVSESWSR